MFTDKNIQSLKPKAKPYRVYEKSVYKGFGIQVSTNSKVFFIQYKSPVTLRRSFMRLGKYPEMPIKMAREQGRLARQLIDLHKDPVIEREENRKRTIAALEAKKAQELQDKNTGTVTQLFESYIDDMKKRGKNSYKNVESIFNNDIKSAIGQFRACDVQPLQIRTIIKSVYMRGAKIQASQTLAFIRAAYSFGLRSDNDAITTSDIIFRLDTNPAANIPKPAKSKPRERNLSAEEIKDLWHRLDTSSMELSTRTVIKLLFATGGQRVEEVLHMRWDEVDFERHIWELSSSRTKNSKPHVVPLSDLAIETIKLMESNKKISDYVFPVKKKTDEPMDYHTISRAVKRFCTPLFNKDGSERRPGFTHFVPKDIRRTVKSRMGEVGISKDIRDRLHNHALHDVSSKHYDRYDYLQPKKDAITAWTEWLENIIYLNHPIENQSEDNYQEQQLKA